MTRSSRNLEGWSIYPRNLCLSAAEVDAKGYDRRLAQAEKRLFAGESVDFDESSDTDEDENVAQILDFGSIRQDGSRIAKYTAINSTSELTEIFQKPRCSWVFFLYQYDSWGQLRVSAEFLKKLFSFLRVHPEYLDIVFLFAEKSGPVEQSYSSFFSHCRPLSSENLATESGCSYGENTQYPRPGWIDVLKLQTLDTTSSTWPPTDDPFQRTHSPCAKPGYIMATMLRRSRPNG
ncbi:uncharacterized protein ANIA_11210 [Aspergillus nidulans FGSC A4]|uniref:CorA-like transporter domain-containing protein n=1 Tax=Emericella nidulans (strain FGSC A4 / ATCC 38163 / CBS 112.46 / NRRL 194 / M139) TaxID=227321 RepID=C8VQQ3_EMENI|nr:hypothetical protein [Aspergillus nidulans FGSC A4]CBF87360.1 TPA: conserved hypothetical protein [Aspergillus nidulans FGSC A4]